MRLNDRDSITVPPDGRPEEAQPQWRRDFPIDIPQDEYVSRRDFTKFMVLISFAFVVGQFWIVLQNIFRRSVGKLPIKEIAQIDSLQIGDSHMFEYPGSHNPCLLIRTGAQEFVAFSQQCTHLSCPVIPDASRSCLRCPCHEGLFDMGTGAPISGPPRRPLPKIELQLKGNKIYAIGVKTA